MRELADVEQPTWMIIATFTLLEARELGAG
jgi:hypothetical protein